MGIPPKVEIGKSKLAKRNSKLDTSVANQKPRERLGARDGHGCPVPLHASDLDGYSDGNCGAVGLRGSEHGGGQARLNGRERGGWRLARRLACLRYRS